MKVIYLDREMQELPSCVATIGVFDGVHRGHQMLIRQVISEARKVRLSSVVITFDRLPRQVLDPNFRPQLLTTFEEKQRLLAHTGVDYLVVLPFSRELAALSAEAFMRQVLRDRLNVKVLLTGYDNRFGHQRTEGFNDYVRYGKEMGMQVLRGEAEMMGNGDRAISSSAIRELLSQGRVELMPEYLTRNYQVAGKVVQGYHIGHELGFPTANLQLNCPDKLIPASGVYAVWAALEGEDKERPAMMNIGARPTFDGTRQTLEVNIFDFEGDLYGKQLTVTFVSRLREERRFESPEALTVQLRKDKEAAEVALLGK